MSLFIPMDVIKYHIIQFVYHSDIFQMLYRVPNKDFHLMVIAELRRRHRRDISIRDFEHNLIQYLYFARECEGIEFYYQIRPLVLYSNISDITIYKDYNKKITQIKLRYYKIRELRYYGRVFFDTVCPSFKEDYPIIRMQCGLTGEMTVNIFPTTCQSYMFRCTEGYEIQVRTNSKQSFQRIVALIRTIFRSRALVFGPNYCECDHCDIANFDPNYYFPGNIPRSFMTALKKICFQT